MHPVHERVLTVREAARFQAFKDDYYFFGNKTQHLKQVGKAVPTLLAYQIAREIKKKTGCFKSIDLFCGAGGMTEGFKMAGIQSLLSNDIEESACITLKMNNPQIKVLCGDITKEETKNAIEKAALDGGADIICGEPPCQGFSMAGFRSEDDPRNQLFREFVDIVKRVSPKVIVIENVEGLLSYQGGKTYREVHTLFTELGYNTEGRILMASDYAVPQKRKRVIIICTRNDMDISPGELFPTPITVDESCQVTARETIADLENVPCDDTAKYVDYDFMYSITKNELPEKDMLVNIAFEYYSKIYQNRKFICLTTSKGLQMFSETGNIQEIYDTYVNAADKESRIKVLKNMIVGINNGDLFILDDDKINICPGMEIENHNKKLIINGYDFEKKNFTAVDKFIFSLDDQSIINTFNNFKDYIIHARKVYPKEYSIRFIEGLIVKLEHMNIE